MFPMLAKYFKLETHASLCLGHSCRVNAMNDEIIACSARFSPGCSFVVQNKGKQFIEDWKVKLHFYNIWS